MEEFYSRNFIEEAIDKDLEQGKAFLLKEKVEEDRDIERGDED